MIDGFTDECQYPSACPNSCAMANEMHAAACDHRTGEQYRAAHRAPLGIKTWLIRKHL